MSREFRPTQRAHANREILSHGLLRLLRFEAIVTALRVSARLDRHAEILKARLTASLDALRPRRQGVGSEEFFEQLDDFIIARQIPDELGQRFRHQRRRVVADFFVLFEKLGIIERAAHGLLKNRYLIIRRAWRQHERSPG